MDEILELSEHTALGNEILLKNIDYINRLKSELDYCEKELDTLKQQISTCRNLKTKTQLYNHYQKFLDRYGVALEKMTITYMAGYQPIYRLLQHQQQIKHIEIEQQSIPLLQPHSPIEETELTPEFLASIYKKYED
jgi:hypothetical protein